jgi:ubiquinone biosynthesis accessory factor UbiJ
MAVAGQHDNTARAAPAPVERLRALVEAEVNRLVGASTAAGRLLERLNGQSFAVHVEGLGVAIALHAEGERLRVDGDAVGATASVRATPFDLLCLANAGGVTGVRRTNAVVSGDLQAAERFAELLKLARPDLEGEVARLLGDIPAHALGEAARGARGWLARAAAALRMNTAEYLQEEQRVVPSGAEAQAFFADVERLRDDVERAAARVARLARR